MNCAYLMRRLDYCRLLQFLMYRFYYISGVKCNGYGMGVFHKRGLQLKEKEK